MPQTLETPFQLEKRTEWMPPVPAWQRVAASRAGAGHGEALTHPAATEEGGGRPSPRRCQRAALMCRAERRKKKNTKNHPGMGSAGG